jgi:hypothetical protein
MNSVVTALVQSCARLDAKYKRGRVPLDMALGVGLRGRAGGPPPVYEETAALLRRFADSGVTQ